MDEKMLKKFRSDPHVSETFHYLPPEAWEGRDPADYHDYQMTYSYKLQLWHSLGLDECDGGCDVAIWT
jgi:hypothetical protein